MPQLTDDAPMNWMNGSAAVAFTLPGFPARVEGEKIS